MDVSRSVLPHFFISLTSISSRSDYLYIPEDFIKKKGNTIPETVFLYFRNGDVFECRYNAEKECFVGMAAIIRRFNLVSHCFLVFHQFADSEFGVIAITNACVEKEYPRSSGSHEFQNVYNGVVPTRPHQDSCEGYIPIDVDLNDSLLRYNAGHSVGQEIIFNVKPCHINISSDGLFFKSNCWRITYFWHDDGLLFLHTPNREWIVGVKRSRNGWFIKEGWSAFVSEVGLSVGDLLILREFSDRQWAYEVAIFRKYEAFGRSVRTGSCKPCYFMKIVGDLIRNSCLFLVPKLFAEKYYTRLPPEIELYVYATGKSYRATYDQRTRILEGLADMFDGVPVEENYMLLFEYQSHGYFVVYIFGDNACAANF